MANKRDVAIGMTVGICGYGWVGKAMKELFPSAHVYDPILKKGTRAEINKQDLTFICVPTPNKSNGALDTSIVEDCVGWCKSKLIVIRSTVQPGTCDKLVKKTGKNIVMQPEYLGETVDHPLRGKQEHAFLVIGGKPKDRRKLIVLYHDVYNANTKIRQVTNLEAEVIKLSENRAIAFKVAQCQELYDACEAAGIDYYTIRDIVYGDDPRFNLWFTYVFPSNRGFNSKCLPKDVLAWAAWAESLNYNPEITNAILDKNKQWVR